MPRVLLLEDDGSLGRTLAERLQKEQLSVTWVQTIAAADAALADGPWDLAILDVMLPDGSGFTFAKRMRQTTNVPIMFMTALNSAENRLEGFEIGAEEYLPKPFHLKELMIRVRHVLERPRSTRTVQVNDLTIDLDAMSVERRGARTFLQVRDCKVLEMLINAS